MDYLVRGLCGGFRIGCRASVQDLQSVLTNMPLATLHPEVIENYLRDEVESNRVVEVPHSVMEGVHISWFGAIPKKRQPGGWRLIVDLSSLPGNGVNDYISPLLCSLSYASVEDVAAFSLKGWPGCSSGEARY